MVKIKKPDSNYADWSIVFIWRARVWDLGPFLCNVPLLHSAVFYCYMSGPILYFSKPLSTNFLLPLSFSKEWPQRATMLPRRASMIYKAHFKLTLLIYAQLYHSGMSMAMFIRPVTSSVLFSNLHSFHFYVYACVNEYHIYAWCTGRSDEGPNPLELKSCISSYLIFRSRLLTSFFN